MPPSKLFQLAELGQSIWLDHISRDLIVSGGLNEFIQQGVRGLTSNPAIFHAAISGSSTYDAAIAKLKEDGLSAFEIYDALTVKDIQDAADLFCGVYYGTEGLDGYVSLELDPRLANDAEASITEGRRLAKKVNRPNVMIKVPATEAGYPVIEELLSLGINVNVTLIFSRSQYVRAVEAYFNGLQRLSRNNGDLKTTRSVASVFVSRIDSLIDKKLGGLISETADLEKQHHLKTLKGKAALANSRSIYELSRDLFAQDEFTALKRKDAAIQRVLWGSTSTKNPIYRDVMYLEGLIAPDTINTVPQAALEAFLDHGRVEQGFTDPAIDAEETLKSLKAHGLDVDEICRALLDAGLTTFEKAFNDLLLSIENKAAQLCAQD